MQINDELIKKLEKLSNISLNEKEEERIKNDLNELLKYMEILNNINVEEVDEMISPIEISESILRKDEVDKFEDKDLITKNFPETKNGLLRVPGIHI